MHYYNEFNPEAAAGLRELMRQGFIPQGHIDKRSILDVNALDLIGYEQCHFFAGVGGWPLALRLIGWQHRKGLWTGSPPCQPFSEQGDKKGRTDERHLAPKFAELVRHCRPGLLFGEQVQTARTIGRVSRATKRAPASAPEWAWADDLRNRLETARYTVGVGSVPARAVGGKHRRKRLFFGAFTDAERDQQRREKQCDWQAGRMGRIVKPVSWDRSWQSALSEFRILADGLPRLICASDGARNAIVPEAAAEFMSAFIDAI